MPRIACFFVPLFPLAARLRSEPELLPEAVAVFDGNGNAAHVVAATRRARKGGIRPGLSLPQARAILPRLIARARDAACERAAQDALLEVAERFSPRIENAGDGVVYLDLEGLERLYPPPGGERTLAQSAIRDAEGSGLPIRAGIASSKLAARVASKLPGSPNIVPAGDEPAFLAPLPLARLAPEIRVATTLERWGIASIGDFARLPEAEVAARLGETGRALHYAARGIDPRPLMPVQPPPSFEEGMDLEWPLVMLEPFVFVANAALDRLSARLAAQGYSCRRLDLALRLDPDGWDARSIDMPAPTRDVKTMLTLAKLDLEARPPTAPIAAFLFTAHPDPPRRAQLSLFGPPALSPDRLATAVARIASMVGAERVGMPVTVGGFRPERYATAAFDPPPPPSVKKPPKKGRGLLAVRVIRPPLPLEVIAHETDDELRIDSIRTLPPPEGDAARDQLEIAGIVRVASGPWALEEAWWSDAPTTRAYWDVELTNGGVYRLFTEGKGWFVDGMFD
ncbi:MAG: DNA polymerase Y family protein [Thermoanaerobaculia bacterium]